jgi:hypothetical protein
MANLYGFNADEIEPSQPFDVLPAGEYRALATSSETKKTKSETGSYLEITWELVDAPYNGRKVWSRLNLDNPNAQAVEISKRELSAICRAVGITRPNDSEELHNIPIWLKIGQETRKDNGELSNKIKGYRSLTDTLAVAASTKSSSATSAKKPWEKK